MWDYVVRGEKKNKARGQKREIAYLPTLSVRVECPKPGLHLWVGGFSEEQIFFEMEI